jgi:DNA ligase D-like protein (predicted 3'-phosphoesterase)
MSLIKYRLKRDFEKTNEPKPVIFKNKESGNNFVIQEHNASQLHYDFRLEIKDAETKKIVLKSWAIPKNIPLEVNKKHLAIQTEDHPIEYLNFEGNIPIGSYGAGSVKIWDQGKWGLMKGDLNEGKMSFNLLGDKIKGRYIMIKTKGYQNKGWGKHWLVWRKEIEMF